MTAAERLRAGGGWILASVAYVALIAWMSSAPRPLPEFLLGISFLDKVIHLVEYGVLAALVHNSAVRAWPEARGLDRFTFVVVTVLCVGVLDEMEQSLVPGRSSSVYDVLADVTGAVLVAGAGWMRHGASA